MIQESIKPNIFINTQSFIPKYKTGNVTGDGGGKSCRIVDSEIPVAALGTASSAPCFQRCWRKRISLSAEKPDSRQMLVAFIIHI